MSTSHVGHAVALAFYALRSADVQKVAALAERAMDVFGLDVYAMSLAVMFAQPLLAPGSGFDWHAALTAGICLSAKLLYEERIFASDASHFTNRYSSKYLIALEARTIAAWLPSIGHIHKLAFNFRTSLLDLVLEHAPSSGALAPCLKEVTILIVEEDVILRAAHEAVARAVAPNATILCAGYYAAACDEVLAREEAGSPVHLVLAGACADEACALSVKATVRAVTDFMDAIDPLKGVIHTGMRERPLTAAILNSAARGAVHQALWGVVDAALPGGRVGPTALHILLDFICERHLGEIAATEPPVEDLLAVEGVKRCGGSGGAPMGGAAHATVTPLPPPHMLLRRQSLVRVTLPPPHLAPAAAAAFTPPQPPLMSSVWVTPPPQLAHAAHAAFTPPQPPMMSVGSAALPTFGSTSAAPAAFTPPQPPMMSVRSAILPTFDVPTVRPADGPRPAFSQRAASFCVSTSMLPASPQPTQHRSPASKSRFSIQACGPVQSAKPQGSPISSSRSMYVIPTEPQGSPISSSRSMYVLQTGGPVHSSQPSTPTRPPSMSRLFAPPRIAPTHVRVLPPIHAAANM